MNVIIVLNVDISETWSNKLREIFIRDPIAVFNQEIVKMQYFCHVKYQNVM